MAKQVGDIKIIGCIDNIQFYKMDGNYYARKKSSLTGRRVKTDKAFAITMAYADLMKIASPLASKVYLQLPKTERDNTFRRKLIKMAMQMIKQGIRVEAIYEQLYDYTFPTKETIEIITQTESVRSVSFADELLNRIFSNGMEKVTLYTVCEALPP
jgi:hypothetical protein